VLNEDKILKISKNKYLLFDTFNILSLNNKLVFVSGKPFQPGAIKHLRVLGPFVSYEENYVL
jgi:hypothetical protein